MNNKHSFLAQRRKILLIIEIVCLVLLFSLFLSLPLFSYRAGFTFIPIAITVLLGIGTFVYALVRKKIVVPAWFIIYFVFLLYAFLISLLFLNSWYEIRSLFFVSAMMLVISEFLLLYNKIKVGLGLYCLSGFIFCFVLLFKSVDFLPGRIGGFFGNENDIALYLLLLTACFLILEVFIKGRWKFLLTISSIFPAFLTICTGARFAFIGLLLCYVVYFVGVIKKRWVIFVSLLVILAVALLLFVLFPSSALVRRFNDLLSTIFGGDMFDGSTSVRLSMVRDGLSLFSKNALFGYGLGGFDANVSYQMSHSHCTIIELLVDCGLIGSSFYFLSLYFALRWPPKKMVTLIFIVVSIPCFLFTVIMSNKFYLSFLGLLSSTCLHEIPFNKIK